MELRCHSSVTEPIDPRQSPQTKRVHSNNNGGSLAPLLKAIRYQRYRGSGLSTMGPTRGHHRGHQMCSRQPRPLVAKLLLSLETGVCLGPSVGTSGSPVRHRPQIIPRNPLLSNDILSRLSRETTTWATKTHST